MTLPEINRLINDSIFATLGFVDSNGNPSVRKVFCRWHKGIGRHYISTNTSSLHVKQLLEDSRACLYFDNCQTFEGVCFTGKVVVHFDHKHKAFIWDDNDVKYYPDGVDDEDYCVIEFIAENGRYYRYDGKGDISTEEINDYDKNAEWVNF